MEYYWKIQVITAFSKCCYYNSQKERGKLMKKKIITILIMTILSLSLFACGGNSESTKSQEKEYVPEDEIKDIFSKAKFHQFIFVD